ncbi:MAG: carbon-nitrogen hydrolase family protein, partial [Chloroflexota bacterium]|nr:carbon-nitrogen hydrolase family protein [Chloroflexota bacterium]
MTFGETWLPSYPAWLDPYLELVLWNHEAMLGVFALLRRNSFVVRGEETARLSELVRELGITLVLGIR